MQYSFFLEEHTTFASLFVSRYRDGQSPASFSSGSVPPAIETVLNHKSYRSFLPKPLPDGTLEILLRAAQSGSTSFILQTWDVIVIADPEHKDAVAKLAGDQDFIRQAPLFLVFCPNLHRAANPAKALSNSVDATIAGQNASIAAESLGLGICFAGAVRNNAQQICELLKLPPLTFAIFRMTVGYPNLSGEEAIKPRLPMREICHRETWSEDGQESNVAAFDQSLGTFFFEQMKVGRKTWGEFVAGNLATGNLDGRENIKSVLTSQAFESE
ncbi:unnamed protein product [Penicillium viridicatum]